MGACEKAQQWTHALQLLSELTDAGLRADTVALSAGISACARGLHWTLALHLLTAFARAAQLAPDSVSCSAAVAACGACGQWERTTTLLHQMVWRGMRPGPAAVGSALEGCRRGTGWQASIVLLAQISRLPSFDGAALIAEITAASACERAGEMRAARSAEHSLQRCLRRQLLAGALLPDDGALNPQAGEQATFSQPDRVCAVSAILSPRLRDFARSSDSREAAALCERAVTISSIEFAGKTISRDNYCVMPVRLLNYR
ncbi:unnamed protein product [Polarella glacialis]|uniref:Pentatricopeptide repeat-containing protein, chloroplastic n=1 Tax=Polarella glacialis TaxID=89957 RepID=A0A813KFD3_POLGL|nr:unnamed protein product [Polarella glacialis]